MSYILVRDYFRRKRSSQVVQTQDTNLVQSLFRMPWPQLHMLVPCRATLWHHGQSLSFVWILDEKSLFTCTALQDCLRVRLDCYFAPFRPTELRPAAAFKEEAASAWEAIRAAANFVCCQVAGFMPHVSPLFFFAMVRSSEMFRVKMN